MTQQEINSIIEDYKNGDTIESLIKKYHHRFEFIKKALEDNNVPLRSRKGKPKYVLADEEEKEIVEKYNAGQGLASIGKDFKISQYKVKEILKRNGIKLRTAAEATAMYNKEKRKYFCNENYFKIENQNENMCYILGFIAADGTVRKESNSVKITLSQKDAELLEKIKVELGYTGPIKYETTNKGFDIATLSITCQEYKQDLAKYNIVPAKTFSFTISDNIKREYLIDFIRGYWDGDGTICTAGREAIRASLCGANKNTLQQIIDFLYEEYNIPKVNIQSRKDGKNDLYYFQYSNNSTLKLYKAFYYKDNLLYLNRKKEKFDLLCKNDEISTRQRLSLLREQKIC